MKKTVRIIALLLALATCACLFISCNKESGDEPETTAEVEGALSGTYVSGSGDTREELKFSGDNVSYTIGESGSNFGLSGKYSVDGNKISFNFETPSDSYLAAMAAAFNEKPIDFEEGDGFILVGGQRYQKQ